MSSQRSPQSPQPRVATPAHTQRDQAVAQTPPQPTRLSTFGRHFIIQREGVRETYYNDEGGLCTYGIGTLVTPPRPCTPAELRTRVPEDRINASLDSELRRAEETVRASVTAPLTQAQFDALVSLTYNAGGGTAARNSGAQPVFRAINSQGAGAAAIIILRTATTVPIFRGGRIVGHRTSHGLVHRRNLEMLLFTGRLGGQAQ